MAGDNEVLNVGVVGYGYWGPNLVRNFHESMDCSVGVVCDLDEGLLEKVQRRYPTIATTTSLDEVLGNPDIDAVAIVG